MIGQTLGRYLILDKLGSGGMGDVYRARDLRLEREVAIKVLSSKALVEEMSRKRFRKEALALSRLNHPNIATILDFDSYNDVDFLVMEYIVGTTLNFRLEAGPLPEKEILSLGIQIADGLEEAHSMGVVHRDLKPNNVFVTPKGQVKILDFGLAKLLLPLSSQQAGLLSTETNLVLGTLPYMSPEQLRGTAIDGRSDIYSFGVVLYEMSTGKRPHQETQPISLADAILNRVPSPPSEMRPDLSPKLQNMILKCLEKDPENRYQSAAVISKELREMATPSLSIPVYETGIHQRRSPLRLRKFAFPAGVLLLLIAAILAGYFVFKKSSTTISKQTPFGIHSIVALPSKVYASDENSYLADAIPNLLSTHLLQLTNLETKVPPTSVDLQRIGGDISKIAQVYGVNGLISSSITAEGDRFVLNVQLINASSRRLLWSREYEGKKGNYIELVRNAAEGLREALSPSGLPIQSAAAVSQNSGSELLYQRGYYYLRSFNNRKQQEDFDRALADLKSALDADPNNARAAAAIARLYTTKIEAGTPLRELLPEINRWAYRALQLDHNCGEAWQVLSVVEELSPTGDQRKRLEYALKAATYASYSGYSHHVLSAALAPTSFNLSLDAAREGIRLEPVHLNGLLFTAGILTRQGNAKEGLRIADKVLALEPDMPVAVMMKTYLLLRQHRPQDAEPWKAKVDQFAAQHRLLPGWVDFATDWMDFEKNRAANRKEEEGAALQRMVALARGEAPPFPRWQLLTGNILGDEVSFDPQSALQTMTIRAEKGILEPYDWLVSSDELKPIRKDPRFQALIEDSKKKFEETAAVLDEAKKHGELPAYLEKSLAEIRNLK